MHICKYMYVFVIYSKLTSYVPSKYLITHVVIVLCITLSTESENNSIEFENI